MKERGMTMWKFKQSYVTCRHKCKTEEEHRTDCLHDAKVRWLTRRFINNYKETLKKLAHE